MHAGGNYKKPSVAVSRAAAEGALRVLQREGLLDGTRKAASLQGEVLIPVFDRDDLADWATRVGGRIVEVPLEAREARPTPHEAVLAALAPELRPVAPEKWELLGDVVILKLSDAALPHAQEIARAFAEGLGARAVVRDATGVSGEFREMRGELLFGEDAVTTHLENGVRYRLDAARIMFASGNLEERKRAAELGAAGETVVDMFAGIGYFTLPLAVHAKPSRVFALEKNPASFAFLQQNVALNRVEEIVKPWLGDNREFPHEGIADRVLLGYFPHTAKFLPKAMALLKTGGGIVHYHDTAHAESWKDEMTRALLGAARACGAVVSITEARVVKSHSPGVVHAVLVARVAR